MTTGIQATAEFREVFHPTAMLSLGNAFDETDFAAWHQRMVNHTGEPHPPVTAELKIDGLAALLVYEQGRLALGATRGNGRTGGRDPNIRNLPLVLAPPEGTEVPGVLEVRGEIYMPKDTFLQLTTEPGTRGTGRIPVRQSPERRPAGAVRQLDPRLAAQRGLMAWVYSSTNNLAGSQRGNLEVLRKLGFPVNPLSRLCRTVGEAAGFHREMVEGCDEWDYEAEAS